MSVMNNAVRGVASVAGASTKTAVGAFNIARDLIVAIKGAVDEATYVRTLERLENHAGTLPEVHKLARAHQRHCDATDDLVPSFSKAVAHVLKQRAVQRGISHTNVRALEYHE